MFTFQVLKLYLHKEKTQKLLNQLQFHHNPPYLAEARYPQLDFKTGAIVSALRQFTTYLVLVPENTPETSLLEI